MPKSTTDPRAELAAVPANQQYIFLNVEALKSRITELQKPILNLAIGSGPHGPNAWAAGNYAANLLPQISDRLATAITTLAYLESTPEFQAAEKLIAPILESLAQLEREEAEATQRRGAAEQRHRDALAAAEARALEAARRDPAVVAAAKALEA